MDHQQGMPISRLAVRRSLLSVNLHIAPLDTPRRWLPPVNASHVLGGGLGFTRAELQQHTKNGNGGGGGGSGGGHGAKTKFGPALLADDDLGL